MVLDWLHVVYDTEAKFTYQFVVRQNERFQCCKSLHLVHVLHIQGVNENTPTKRCNPCFIIKKLLSNNLVWSPPSCIISQIAKHPTQNHLIVKSVFCYINLLQSHHIVTEYDIASHSGTVHEHHRIYHQLRLKFTLRIWHAFWWINSIWTNGFGIQVEPNTVRCESETLVLGAFDFRSFRGKHMGLRFKWNQTQ